MVWNTIGSDNRRAMLDGILPGEQERVLDWLRETTQRDMADPNQLAMRPIASFRRGAEYQGPAGCRVFQYEVIGLPSEQQAWIAHMDQRWQILRCANGVQGDWSGGYSSAEEALRDMSPRADYPQRFGDHDCVIRVWKVNDRFFARPFTKDTGSELRSIVDERGAVIEFCEQGDVAAFGKAVVYLTDRFGPRRDREPFREVPSGACVTLANGDVR
jgi:hypothetical protein